MKQVMIAVDQLVNTVVWATGEGFGHADETLSARAWRLRHRRAWRVFQCLLDRIFWRDKDAEGRRAHCYMSWIAERDRHHFPKSYRAAEADVR